MKRLFAEFYADLRTMKHYLIAATAVFIIGIYVGYVGMGNIQNYMNSSLEPIAQIADQLAKLPYPQIWFFLFIFYE